MPKQTLIMGILNITPDSFYGGNYNSPEKAMERAQQMVVEGADMIDIGGESTRPGASSVPAKEELQRIMPVVNKLARNINVPLSVDTYKAEVAEQALEAGASIINDVWGLKGDPRMAEVAAAYQCQIIITHNRSTPVYKDFLNDIVADLKDSISLAHGGGILDNNIILDPGIGFGKTFEQNLFLLKNLSLISKLGYPVLLGTSRKSVIRNVLQLPVSELNEGTAATSAFGIWQGCNILRVHDVKKMKQLALMCDAVMNSQCE